MCFNCRQRGTGICEFDTEPKRRGPDRQPGARQRHGSTSAAAPPGRRASRTTRSIRGVGSRDVQSSDNAESGEPSTTSHQDAPPGPPPGSFSAERDSGVIPPLPRVVPQMAPLYADVKSGGPLSIHTIGYPGSGIELPALHAAAPLSYAHSESESPSKVLRSQHSAHPQSAAVFVLSPPEEIGYPHDPGVHLVQHPAPAPALFVNSVDPPQPPSLPLHAALLTPPNSAVEFRRASRDSQASLESSVSPPSICSSEPSLQVTSSHFPQPDIVEPEVAVGHPAYADYGTLSLHSAHLVADDGFLRSAAELQKADQGNVSLQ